MLVDGSYEILSCDDVELGIKRSSALSFYACYDDVKEAKALLVIIPGLGADSDSGYRTHLMQTMAENYDVACISVDYHCIGNRPQIGAKIGLDDLDRAILTKELAKIGITLPIDLKIVDNYDKTSVLLKSLSEEITIRKESRVLPELYEALKKLKFDATLHMIKDESEVDGKFIKSLTHGMGMSYKLLLQRELPAVMEKILSQKSKNSSKSIEYKCGDMIYKFSEVSNQINLEILDIA